MKSGIALAALDLSQLRSVTLDDRPLMRELIEALLSDTSNQIERLRAVESPDLKECARQAHSLMGACGNVGAVSLAALFGSLERQATHGDVRIEAHGR